MAGAMGEPYLPTRSSLGTSIVKKWGVTESMRRKDPRLPDKKLAVAENPFGTWGAADRVVLVPAISPDITVIHVQKADQQGTARIEGLPFSDVEQVKAAEHDIVTCEELVDTDQLRETPERNQIPIFCVDAVVPLPLGANPTACYRHYDYDPVYLNQDRTAALDDALYETYLNESVYGTDNHQALLDRIDPAQLKAIQADPQRGYAVGLDRK